MRTFLVGVYILMVLAGYTLLREFDWGFLAALGGACLFSLFAIVLLFLVLATFVIDIEFEWKQSTRGEED